MKENPFALPEQLDTEKKICMIDIDFEGKPKKLIFGKPMTAEEKLQDSINFKKFMTNAGNFGPEYKPSWLFSQTWGAHAQDNGAPAVMVEPPMVVYPPFLHELKEKFSKSSANN